MYYKVADARRAAEQVQSRQYVRKSAGILLQDSATFQEGQTYDVFLSHSFKDAEVVLGVKSLIEGQGRSVYVDWVDDNSLDRKNVTRKTADTLRRRMKACSSLIFASSDNSPSSKWMPWELGYFDGLKQGQVAILPLVETYDSEWNGQEYLGLYPVVANYEFNGVSTPFVSRSSENLQLLREFGDTNYSSYKFRTS